MAITEAYIDESYRDGDPRILCVGGYLYRKIRAAEFTRDWRRYLKSNGLPYFHANEIAGAQKEGNLYYGKNVDAICRNLIELTRQKTAYGFAVTVNEDEYNEIVRPREGMPSAYAFALKACVGMVRRWKVEHSALGPTSYFFEQGHKHQNDANDFLNWLLGVPEIAAKYGYSGHAFVCKETEGVQPADYLAWHWRLESVRQLDPNRTRAPRADLHALLRPGDFTRCYTRADLVNLEVALHDAERIRHQTREQIALTQEAAVLSYVRRADTAVPRPSMPKQRPQPSDQHREPQNGCGQYSQDEECSSYAHGALEHLVLVPTQEAAHQYPRIGQHADRAVEQGADHDDSNDAAAARA
ncbi:MAG TPA: hypothetical protein VG960_11105 [Caulobacteraceae bacterium]|nr:hypothetical protein [Caulobacteraceae bacterium]